MDVSTSLMYFGEVPVGGSLCLPQSDDWRQENLPQDEYCSPFADSRFSFTHTRSTTHVSVVTATGTVSALEPQFRSIEARSCYVSTQSDNIWEVPAGPEERVIYPRRTWKQRLATWWKSWTKRAEDPTKGQSVQCDIEWEQAVERLDNLLSVGEQPEQPAEEEIPAQVTTVTTVSATHWGLRAARAEDKALVLATKEVVRAQKAEQVVFGDSSEGKLEAQTYKKFVENEWMRGRKRGTRGKMRPYQAKEVEYCSLMETAYRLMSEPQFTFTKAELGDVYREMMALHKRDGCEVGFAGQTRIEYQKIAAGSHMAMIASVCRDVTRVGEGFVQSHFELASKARCEDLKASWLAHWAATQARTRPSLWQRWLLIWWGFNDRLGLSAPLPPLQ